LVAKEIASTGTADAQVEPPRVEGIDQAELFYYR
jgi:hypothetical protein